MVMAVFWRICAVVSCVAVAALSVVVFHHTQFKQSLPFLFIVIIGLLAARFGTWTGHLAVVGCTIIFAAFLFEPLNSMRVTDMAQRGNLVWMVIGGISLSEILGVSSEAATKTRERKNNSHTIDGPK